ncbi:13238_t:CDS:2, partial [Gigaspora rosea]
GSLCHMSPTFFETSLLEIFLSSAIITGCLDLRAPHYHCFSPKDHGACLQ